MVPINTIKRWYFGIGLLIVFVLIDIKVLTGCMFNSTVAPQASVSSKAIVSNSLPLQEIWRRSGLTVLGDKSPPQILIKSGLIIISIKDPQAVRYRTKIMALNIQTGELIWESKSIFANTYSLSADEQNLYASYLRYVQAYDLKTGKDRWQGLQQPQSKRGGLEVYATGDQVDVYDIDTSKFPLNQLLFSLNPETGRTIKTMNWANLFFHQGHIYYASALIGGSFGAGITAKDKQTGHTLWELDTISNVRRWPIMEDDTMFIDAGDVYAFNSTTGEVYWIFEDIDVIYPKTGNADKRYENRLTAKIAYGDRLFFFLRSDGSIVGLNPKTGEPIGEIEIDPPPNYYADDGSFQDTHYLIAASDEFVAVYYNDSQELIVFKRQDVAP